MITTITIEGEFCADGGCEIDQDPKSEKYGKCIKCDYVHEVGFDPGDPEGDWTVSTVNLALEGTLLPPAPDVCQKCAVKHEPHLPHNQQSLAWQYWFYKDSGGRWPTWKDAMAHCTDEMKAHWVEALKGHGIDVEAEAAEPG